MHSKTNRVNHDFQILHFLAGSCHTADGAYALLCDLRDDRADALKHYEAARLREQAKRVRAQVKINDADEAAQLDGLADIEELEAGAETVRKNVLAARAELDFIQRCIERLQPHRKYAHLPDAEAHEACQAEEWRLELIGRAQNYLLTGQGIPADQFATMRMHPDFASHILPAVEEIKRLAPTPEGRNLLLGRPAGGVDLPKLLAPPA